MEEPAVDLGQLENGIHVKTGTKSVADVEDAFGAWGDELALDFLVGRNLTAAPTSAAQAVRADFKRAECLLECFLERAADRHRFPDGFHLRGERGVGLREFLEGEPRDFHDDIINGRLEARR